MILLTAIFCIQVISHAGIKIPHRAQMQYISPTIFIPIETARNGFAVQGIFIHKIILQKRVHVDIFRQCIQRNISIRSDRQVLYKCIQRLVKVLDSLLQQRRIVLGHRLFQRKISPRSVIFNPDTFFLIKPFIRLHENTLGIVQIQAAAADLRLFAY